MKPGPDPGLYRGLMVALALALAVWAVLIELIRFIVRNITS